MKKLTAEDLVVGNKYVPHSKSWQEDDELKYSVAWQKAQTKGQPYLYYVGFDEDEGAHMFWWEMNEDDGDYFLPSDVTPYFEPGAKVYESPAQLSEVKWDDSADPLEYLPFNLEEALKAPERVVRKDGYKPVEWHYFKSCSSRWCITVVGKDGRLTTYDSRGMHSPDGEGALDLMLLPPIKKTYWVNVMEESFSGRLYTTGPWESEAKAFQEVTMPDRLLKRISFTI